MIIDLIKTLANLIGAIRGSIERNLKVLRSIEDYNEEIQDYGPLCEK